VGAVNEMRNVTHPFVTTEVVPSDLERGMLIGCVTIKGHPYAYEYRICHVQVGLNTE
jgi:hypothetical protein